MTDKEAVCSFCQDMYEHVDMPLAKHRTSIEGMPGMAWHQQGFYSAENGTVWVPMLDRPIPDYVQRDMRRAYYSAVSWMVSDSNAHSRIRDNERPLPACHRCLSCERACAAPLLSDRTTAPAGPPSGARDE